MPSFLVMFPTMQQVCIHMSVVDVSKCGVAFIACKESSV